MNFENNEILTFIYSSSVKELIDYCFSNNLIQNSCCCIHCGVTMKLKKSKDCCDGFVWQCRNFECLKFQTTLSIRKNSVFEKFNISLKNLLLFIFHWSCGLLTSEICQFIVINKNTAVKLRAFLISQIRIYFIRFPIQLGGPFKQVDIDETMLTHSAKSHRGRSPRRQIYALCIKEVGENVKKGFCTVLTDRSARSILPVIYRVVIPGTVIHTDEWASYNHLSRSEEYVHLTVCHKYNFVNPISGTHTQNVESYNSKLKLRIKKMKGIICGKHEDFCLEFMWLDNFGKNGFEKVFELLLIN